GVALGVALGVGVTVTVAVGVAVAVAVGVAVAVAVGVGVGVGVAPPVTSRYWASLGMPLVNTVTRAGPGGNPVTGTELKETSDHPPDASASRNVTWLLSILRSCTTG